MFSDIYSNLFSVNFRINTQNGKKKEDVVFKFKNNKPTLKEVEKVVDLYAKNKFGDDCSSAVISYKNVTNEINAKIINASC
jgi:hypothetical protein